jgi:hypothetical protein
MAEKVNIPLPKFQEWMQQLLLDPFQQTEVNPANILPEHLNSLEDVVHDSSKLAAKDHLAIYQRSYIARLRNCMATQFSALEYALGEDIFTAFADDYLASRPSYNYNLALLGKHFPEYLEANRPDKEAPQKEDWIDFVIELAQFEYDLGVIFEQKAEEDYELAQPDTLEENLQLVPICELFQFDFPTRQFYSDFRHQKEPNLPYSQKAYCVVLRHNFKLTVYDLHQEQYEFLHLLKNGLTVPQAKTQFKNHHSDFDTVWSNWKSRWIEAKIFRV